MWVRIVTPASSGQGGERHAELRRVHLAVGVEEARADHAFGRHQREPVARLVGRDLVQRQVVGLGPADLTPDLLEPLGRRGELDATALDPAGCVLGLLQPAVELDGVHVHPGERRICPELSDQSGGMERRSTGELGPFEEHHVGLTQLGQVVGDARAADAASDHHDTRLGREAPGGSVVHAAQRRDRRGFRSRPLATETGVALQDETGRQQRAKDSGGVTMPKYMFKASYGSEGAAGVLSKGAPLVVTPSRRRPKSVGGKLESFYFAFGGTDAFVIVELPDNATAATMALTVSSSGVVGVETAVLIDPDEIKPGGLRARTTARPVPEPTLTSHPSPTEPTCTDVAVPALGSKEIECPGTCSLLTTPRPARRACWPAGGMSRRDVVAKATASVGGEMLTFNFAFGRHDAFVMADLPSHAAASKIALSINASGSARVETVVLLEPEDVEFQEEESISYTVPGEPVSDVNYWPRSP